jgi:hypothetical protein
MNENLIGNLLLSTFFIFTLIHFRNRFNDLFSDMAAFIIYNDLRKILHLHFA